KRTVLTASKTQVIQPVYKTSVKSWKRYEKELQPLIRGLKAIGAGDKKPVKKAVKKKPAAKKKATPKKTIKKALKKTTKKTAKKKISVRKTVKKTKVGKKKAKR
ncbi:MAG TPA: hypothetical protein VIG74_00905, partial [Alphaproteobacteria bacterium]